MKVIAISGLARGGTNILWNAIQSHPSFCSALYETNEILERKEFTNKYARLLIKKFDRLPYLAKVGVARYARSIFNEYKMLNLDDTFNKYKSEGELYNKEEIRSCNLVLKGVTSLNGFELRYAKLLNSAFSPVYNLRLIRNGYAVCEAWVRRGGDPYIAGKVYKRFGEQLIGDREMYENYRILKYEDFIKDIFGGLTDILSWVGVSNPSLSMIRLKTKKVLQPDGYHKEVTGEVNHKYWISKDEIYSFVDADINQRQIARLSPQNKVAFEMEALPILEYFDYV